MGRYGPPAFVTDRSGELLAAALEQAGANVFGGIERGRERTRQAQLDADVATDRRFRQYDAGIREGAAPSGDVTLEDIATSRDLSFPSGRELARHLSIGGPSAPAGSGGLAAALPTPALTTNQPAPFAAPPPGPAGHPGAFDPVSGSFRNGQGMAKPKPAPIGVMKNDRYAQIDDQHYLDRAETPDARREGAQYRAQDLERELAAQERNRKVDSLMRAYQIPREKADALVDNPGLADNELYPPESTATPRRQLVRNSAGDYVSIDLATGLGPDGKPVRGYDAPRSNGSSDDNVLVQVQQPDGSVVYMRRSQAAGLQAPSRAANAGGAAERAKRIQAFANAADALDQFETTLNTVGSVVKPGVEKSGLEMDYENLQLQLKELYNLGVLNGPDLALMRRIINDPTSLKGRVLAGGSAEEQTARIAAQVTQMRTKLEGFTKNLLAGSQAIQKPAAPSGRGANPAATPSDTRQGVTLPAPAGSGASREQQLWDAAVKKHGEARVLQEYGPRPPR